MELDKKKIIKSYIEESNSKTLKIGLIFSIAGIPLYLASIFQDVFVLTINEFVYFRLVSLIPFILYIIFYFSLFKKNNKIAVFFHVLNLISVMVMIIGMNIIVFTIHNYSEYIFGIMIATIVSFFAIFLFSAYARNYLVYIIMLPLGFLYFYLFIQNKLNMVNFTYLNIYFISSVAIIIIAFILEKMSFNEFKMRKLAEFNRQQTEDAENKAKESKKKAENAEIESKLKSKFLAIMSHELRTPLNGIMGFTELLLKKETEKDKVDQLNIIYSQGESLLKIINDILDISRIESGNIKIEEKIFNLELLIENLCSKIDLDLKKSHNKLILEKPENLTKYILSDPLRIEQILINLLSNAIKFTENGLIKIEITEDNEVINNKKKFIFKILDNGIGIKEENLKNIFEKFTQVYDTTIRKYSGTGLGLFIVKELVELLNGKVTVDSRVNEGSAFTVELNLAIPDDELLREYLTKYTNEKKDMENRIYNFESMRIIVAEDNKFNQELVKKMLEMKKCKVYLADNGLEVLKLLENKNQFDMILMDIEMPEMDGYETTIRIRNSENYYKNIPIIAISAYAMQQDRLKTLEVGINDFIAKPIQIETFYNTINKYKTRHL